MADMQKTVKEAEGIMSWIAEDEKDKNHIGVMVTTGFLKDVIELLRREMWVPVSYALPACDWGYEVGDILFCLKSSGQIESGCYGTGGKFRDRYFRSWNDSNEGFDVDSVLCWKKQNTPKEGDMYG